MKKFAEAFWTIVLVLSACVFITSFLGFCWLTPEEHSLLFKVFILKKMLIGSVIGIIVSYFTIRSLDKTK